jgi:integrase
MPAGKGELILLDAVVSGLAVRVYPSGRKSFFVQYRVDGGGRGAPQRRLALGDVSAISLADARKVARKSLGEVAAGADPSGARKVARRRERALLERALDRYEESLARRHVVKRREVMSLLRRELLGKLGSIELGSLDRATLVGRITALEDEARPGAAQGLRSKAAVFLSWATNEGLVSASPLAGWRRERRTRAERVEQPGRALSDVELPTFWAAASAAGWPFGPYLKMLLLLGQRRTETALMRWPDLNLEAGLWTIAAAVTKSGREHKVPLPRPAIAILRELPRLAGSDLVFPGRRGRPMTGWSKRLPPVVKATAKAGMEAWEIHDLRRTMRSGLGALGVEPLVSELLLNHAVSDELTRIYDRGEYWQPRVEAGTRWAAHVLGTVEGGSGKVVQLAQSG